MLIQEDYFRNIFNTVRGAILILDENLRVLSANRSFFNIFRVDAAKTIGTLLYDLGNGQWNIPHLRVLLEEILPNNDTVDDYEIVHDFESIGRKTMLLNACKIREKSTGPSIILLAIEDITERKRLEDLLSESEERYRRLFETASDGIVLLEKSEGHITNVNPSSESMTGFSKTESIGKHLEDIGVAIDMSDFPAIMQSLNYYSILNYTNVPVKTRSGQEIFTDIYLVDRAKVAQCNIRDVTERKQAEEKLKLSEARLIEAQAMAKVGSWETDLLTLEVIWSEETYRIFEIDPDGFQSHSSFLEFVHPEDRAKVEAAFVGAIDKHMLNTIEHRIVTHGGLVKFIEERWHLFYDNQGIPVRAVGTCQDITDRKHAEEEKSNLEAQLLQSQKMEAVGTLAGGIAHDFNNILHVIMGYGSLVMEKLGTDSPSRENMNQVLIAADRAADLTKKLLVFSRKQAVDVKPVQVNAVILVLEKMLVRIIRENIEFRLELTDKQLIVQADAGQIEQVLINLAANSRDAMKEGGRLTIRTDLEEMDEEYVALYGYGKPGKYALITVSDTGQGMDAETRKKIFEPFFITKGIGEGTGLGLSISYGIIKQHGGYINVYSEPGHGTAFKIYLPLSEVAALPDLAAEEPDAVKGGNETVLIAEDDPSLRQLSRILLETYGYTVIIAGDGEEAITKFMDNRGHIGLVMLDVIMPKKSGKEVCVAIKRVNPEMKILFTSGYTMDVFKAEELTACGTDFISKPFLPIDFLKKVREVLDR